MWFRPSIQAGEGPKRLVCDVRHPERVAEDLRLAGLLPDDVLVTTARIGGRPLTAPIVVTLAGLAVLFGGLGGALAIRDAYGKFASLPALFLVLAVGVPLLFKGMRPLMEALQATEHDQE